VSYSPAEQKGGAKENCPLKCKPPGNRGLAFSGFNRIGTKEHCGGRRSDSSGKNG